MFTLDPASHHENAALGVQAGGIVRDAHHVLAAHIIANSAGMRCRIRHKIERIEMLRGVGQFVDGDDVRTNGCRFPRQGQQLPRNASSIAFVIGDIRIHDANDNRGTDLEGVKEAERARRGLKIALFGITGCGRLDDGYN